MDPNLFKLHEQVGNLCGVERTCGKKVRYSDEAKAQQAAMVMSAKPATRNPLEPYPCVFCKGWHIGRKMVHEELMHHISNALSTNNEPGWAAEPIEPKGEP